jgi:hypothetical protein
VFVFQGRSKRLVRNEKGTFDLCLRKSKGNVDINVKERRHFQNGNKLIGIISDAASTGVSLHADKRVKNTKRRFHITIELPWSADKAVQQFGRSHRSNQTSAPMYALIACPQLAGERRFTSIIASRLQKLGALTQGDRGTNVGGNDLSEYGIQPKLGMNAVMSMFSDFELILRDYDRHKAQGKEDSMLKDKYSMAHCNVSYTQKDFCEDVLEWRDRNGLDDMKPDEKILARFLNRIFNAGLKLQGEIFQAFDEGLQYSIKEMKAAGRMDDKITSISGKLSVSSRTVLYEDPGSGAKSEYVELNVNRGITFEDALAERERALLEDRDCFFYRAKNNAPGYPRDAKKPFVLMIEKKAGRVRGRWYSCVKPNIGYSPIEYSKSDLESKFVKVDDIADPSLHNEVKEEWTKLYEAGDNGKCMHYTCSNQNCEYGKRIRKQGLITGSVMPIWGDLTKVILGSRNSDKDFLKIAKGLIIDALNMNDNILFFDLMN